MTRRVKRHGAGTAFKCNDGPNGSLCAVCVDARRQYNRELRYRHTAELEADPTIRPHGDPRTYQYWGCRCDDCRSAAYAERRRYPPYTTKGRTRAKPFGREWLDDNANT